MEVESTPASGAYSTITITSVPNSRVTSGLAEQKTESRYILHRAEGILSGLSCRIIHLLGSQFLALSPLLSRWTVNTV